MNKLSKKEEHKGVYGLEITTTQACNYNCTYCFERDHVIEEKTLSYNIIVTRVNELLDAEWFKDQYSGIKIILWGGEPTMNMPLCVSLMEAFKDNKRVCFFIYTNGSTMDHLLPTLKELKHKPFIKKNQSKITVQVSYDGQPLHDMNRKDKNCQPTACHSLHALNLLHKHGIDYGLKATIAWKDFKHLPECWDDFKFLYDMFGSKIKYSLTVDYYDVNYTPYKDEVKEALLQVSTKELDFYEDNGRYLSSIFKNNKAFCATGKGMSVVDIDGTVYNCHGAIYSKCSKELQYTNIFDKNFINKIEWANNLYSNNHIEPKECEECISSSCLRCNVKKFEESDKGTHLEKWYDYTSQKDLCEYYKLVGKINAAMESILRSK